MEEGPPNVFGMAFGVCARSCARMLCQGSPRGPPNVFGTVVGVCARLLLRRRSANVFVMTFGGCARLLLMQEEAPLCFWNGIYKVCQSPPFTFTHLAPLALLCQVNNSTSSKDTNLWNITVYIFIYFFCKISSRLDSSLEQPSALVLYRSFSI